MWLRTSLLYLLKKEYLEVAEVNPCINTFENAVSSGIAWTDGEVYSYGLVFPATRVFPVDSEITCEEPDSSSLEVFNNNGEVIDCDTTPFSFCNGLLTF